MITNICSIVSIVSGKVRRRNIIFYDVTMDVIRVVFNILPFGIVFAKLHIVFIIIIVVRLARTPVGIERCFTGYLFVFSFSIFIRSTYPSEIVII